MAAALLSFNEPLWFAELPSTSDRLKECIASGEELASGTVVAAKRQTRGRGRMGSVWQSAAAGDLTFSFYWRGRREPVVLGSLPMACALAVREFLEMPPFGIEALCKWPNDVLVDDAKICGILTEGGIGKDGTFGVVVGMGLNLRDVPDRNQRFGRLTASIEEITGVIVEPHMALTRFLPVLQNKINVWETQGFDGLRQELEAHFWGKGRTITAKTPYGKFEGAVVGLGPEGELMLEDASGQRTAISSVSAIENDWV